MKKLSLFLSIFGIIGFMAIQGGNTTTVADVHQDLGTLASVLQDEDIFITGWSLYAKESLVNLDEGKDPEEIASELKARYPDWDWSGSEGNYVAKSQASKLQEKISFTSTDINGRIHTYIMYEVRGQSWNKHTAAFLSEILPSRLFDIFRGNVRTFSCIEGDISDKIDSALFVYKTELLKAFDAKEIEGLEEDSFISVSAFSPLFDKSLSKDHDMNMQLGLRKSERLGGKTTLVVGTPIITIEY